MPLEAEVEAAEPVVRERVRACVCVRSGDAGGVGVGGSWLCGRGRDEGGWDEGGTDEGGTREFE